MSPEIIGVAGGSCSGKTTYIQKVHEVLGAKKSAILFQDNYYRDQSDKFDRDGGAVNFDHPDALDLNLLGDHLERLKQGESVEVPIYNFATHTRSNDTVTFSPKPIVFLDGILILTHEKIRELLDFAVYIECDSETRLTRRILRDTSERGRSEEGVREQFSAQVEPMHQLFVEPSKQFADLVLTQAEYQAEISDSAKRLVAKSHELMER